MTLPAMPFYLACKWIVTHGSGLSIASCGRPWHAVSLGLRRRNHPSERGVASDFSARSLRKVRVAD